MTTKTPNTLIEVKWSGNPARCSRDECPATIGPGERYMIDKMSESSFCLPCGSSLRYHRKKAVERGQNPPITFADAEKLIEAGRHDQGN